MFQILYAIIGAVAVGLLIAVLNWLIGDPPALARQAGLWAGVLMLVIALLVLASGARAHEAPSGWEYPPACCSGVDCYQISGTDIVAGGAGYSIKATGELVTYADRRIRPSGDGLYHRCSYGGATAASTICLFVPSGS